MSVTRPAVAGRRGEYPLARMSGNLVIEPFEIAVDDATLDDLRARLRATRFPEQLPDAGWDYGTEREYLRELVTYWAEQYDWPARQARMNAFDHFRTEIDGTGVHFLHRAVEGRGRAADRPDPRLAGFVRRVPRRDRAAARPRRARR